MLDGVPAHGTLRPPVQPIECGHVLDVELEVEHVGVLSDATGCIGFGKRD
jgi:hypothetical protein